MSSGYDDKYVQPSPVIVVKTFLPVGDIFRAFTTRRTFRIDKSFTSNSQDEFKSLKMHYDA